MKKLILLSMFLIMTCCTIAQDSYSIGYYGSRKIAAVYKNGTKIYKVTKMGHDVVPKTLTLDSNENVYWLVNYYYNNSLQYTDIRKNDQLYVTTKGLSQTRIIDIYCLNDTLYYIGYQNNEDSVDVAMVWKGTDFTSHLILGDGIHNSYLYDVDVDKSTGIPYFCGCVQEDITKAAVWRNHELLYLNDGENPNPYVSVVYSYASEISIDGGDVYTLGRHGKIINTGDTINETIYCPVIWKNNEVIKEASGLDFMNNFFAYAEKYYYCLRYPHGAFYALYRNDSSQPLLEFDFIHGSSGSNKIKAFSDDIYVMGRYENKGCIWKNFSVYQQFDNCLNVADLEWFNALIAGDSEWYYKIIDDNGNVTYQHLAYTSDTVINGNKAKIIVRTNHVYDKDGQIEITHEYVKERDDKVYWWNKDLHEFTTLYDFAANEGDEWVINVGMDSVTVHVDSVGVFEYEGIAHKMLHVSDFDGVFSGDIVCGFGHMTSFFPEKLMRHVDDFEVKGLRCYWVGDSLLYHQGEEDCDEIYNAIHMGLNECVSDRFNIYPNPTNGIITVSTPSRDLSSYEYHITSVMGQTMMTGVLNGQTIDASSLPSGMYFITIDGTTVKFIKQ